jgi:hypothetical protein
MSKNATIPVPEPAAARGNPPLTVKQLAEQYPAFTEASTRWAIFNAESNGLAESGALLRMGRRVLIDPDLYLAWVRTGPRLSPPKPKATRPRRSAPILGNQDSGTRSRSTNQ